MAEWLKAAVLKTVRGASPSWVRILLPPPPTLGYSSYPQNFAICQKELNCFFLEIYPLYDILIFVSPVVDTLCRIEILVIHVFSFYNGQEGSDAKSGAYLTEKAELINLLKKLFSDQLLAVLGTQSSSGPYGNLVAFAATDDLQNLIFATTRSTRKYENLMETPRVAMVMDNRSNHEIDFREAVAVTATGSVKEIDGMDLDHFRKLYLEKHPYLIDFVTADSAQLN
jgi:uncharacterized protein YhbP (UPF0306 family)